MSIDLQGPSVSETVNGYLKILGKVFSYEPLCMMHGVEILQWVVTDHENMLLEDTWILSCTFLSISVHSCEAEHNSDMEACLIRSYNKWKDFGTHFHHVFHMSSFSFKLEL